MTLKKWFYIGLSIILFFSIAIVIYAKINIKHVDYDDYVRNSLYNFEISDDYENMYNLKDYFIDEKVNSYDDLKRMSDYILIISNDKYPTFRGNGIINNCTIERVIKGNGLKEKAEIKIYDLVSSWKMYETIYLGGSTPLKIGNKYIVFLKKTTRANLSDTYVFTSVKYGHITISEDSKFLKDYVQNSMKIEEIKQYDFVFSSENTEREIAEYTKIKSDILIAIDE